MGWIASWLVLLLEVRGVEITTCTMGSEDAWRTSLLIFTPLSLLILGSILITPKHHLRFVLLSTPLILIVPYCLSFALKFLVGATIRGNHLCAVLKNEPGFNTYPSSWLAPAWAPVQTGILGLWAWVLVRTWRQRSVARGVG